MTEERIVDVPKVDPQNGNFLDMLAYSGHLADSGEYPEAFGAFIDSTANPHGLGNISGHMFYKKFWSFLEQ